MQTIEQLRSGALAGARHLKLSCNLDTFPQEIFELSDTLESLDLSGNALSALPADFGRLRKLRILFCSDNSFTELPEVLGDCPELSMIGFKVNAISEVSPKALTAKLRWLILTNNKVRILPSEIGLCSRLQKLMLAGNELTSLPESLRNCSRLELIRLSANRLDAFPAHLLILPRLSWLAYSGNPFTADLEARAVANAAVRKIQWSDLQVDDVLGQGASGVIHRAHLREADRSAQMLAVKLFKGAMTSDGLPESELAASIAAGAHPNLIGVIGRVADHPSGTNGLVMQLVGPEFESLAGPPSLESCTRDIYPARAGFSVATVLRMASAIASMAQHLHARGIMHGDLYAHNALHAGEGHVLLGDFGASSFYEPDGGGTALSLERIEVRAFGCLLEELVARCPDLAEHPDVSAMLHDMKASTLSDDPAHRPSFGQISSSLVDAISRTAGSELRGGLEAAVR